MLMQSILYLQSNFNWFNTSLTFPAATPSMIIDWLPKLSTTATQAVAEAEAEAERQRLRV